MTKHTLTFNSMDIEVVVNTSAAEHPLTVKNAQSLDKVLKWVYKQMRHVQPPTSIIMTIVPRKG